MGVWTIALCYSRGNELDGFCPLEELDGIATEDVLRALYSVGLLDTCEREGVPGVMVLRYADHNETKEQIEARKSADKARKAKPRAASTRKTSGPMDDSDRIPSGIRLTDHPGIPGSDSDSGSVSDLDLGDPDPGCPEDPLKTSTSATASPDSPDRPIAGTELPSGASMLPAARHGGFGNVGDAVPPPKTLVDLSMPLTEGMRAAASMAGIVDVDRAFSEWKARKKSSGWTSVDWSAAWMAELGGIARRERTERDRNPGQPARSEARPEQPRPPYHRAIEPLRPVRARG